MVALNTVSLTGNITMDPTLAFTKQSVAVVNFTLAHTPRSYNSQLKEWEDGKTLFIVVVGWRGLAENIAESLSKGDRVNVVGSLFQEEWEDGDGNKRVAIKINADSVGPDLMFATATPERIQRAKPEKKTTKRTTAKKTAQAAPVDDDIDY